MTDITRKVEMGNYLPQAERRELLERAKDYFKKGKYESGKGALNGVDFFGGVILDSQVRETYRIAAEKVMEQAEKFLEEGEPILARTALNNVERYASKAGIEIPPENFGDLKKKTAKLGISQELKTGMKYLERKRYGAAEATVQLLKKYVSEDPDHPVELQKEIKRAEKAFERGEIDLTKNSLKSVENMVNGSNQA